MLLVMPLEHFGSHSGIKLYEDNVLIEIRVQSRLGMHSPIDFQVGEEDFLMFDIADWRNIYTVKGIDEV